MVRTRRNQKIHPRASRDRDGPSLWHLVNVGFIPWPRWATTIPPYKTPPFTPIMHLSTHLYQTHISLLQAFLYRLNPLFLWSPSRSIPSTLTTIHPLKQPNIIH